MLVVVIPIARLLVSRVFHKRRELMMERDKRAKLMSELLRNIKGIKASRLEGPLTSKVRALL